MEPLNIPYNEEIRFAIRSGEDVLENDPNSGIEDTVRKSIRQFRNLLDGEFDPNVWDSAVRLYGDLTDWKGDLLPPELKVPKTNRYEVHFIYDKPFDDIEIEVDAESKEEAFAKAVQRQPRDGNADNIVITNKDDSDGGMAWSWGVDDKAALGTRCAEVAAKTGVPLEELKRAAHLFADDAGHVEAGMAFLILVEEKGWRPPPNA